MRVCVVGGTGNISLSFVRLLLEQGHEVTCFNRGQTPGLPDGARLLKGDRADTAAFEATMQREKFDAAIDMICFNADQARSDLRAFAGIGHFVMCSTVCTYGVEYDWLPVTEDHPLRPNGAYGRNKAAADAVFLEAYYRDGFPVTIIKPSTTYGPKLGLLRQVAWEFSWLDRVRRGLPLLVAGDGAALHQYLYVDDAAPAFVHVLGRARCRGQVYNVMRDDYHSWADYHRTAMRVIGREVELVGVPVADLAALDAKRFGGCRDWFGHSSYFSNAKLRRDVPEFHPRVALADGMARVLEVMDREGRVPDARRETWEDAIIATQRRVRDTKLI